MTNKGLLSVVADRNDPSGDTLLVRGRQEQFTRVTLAGHQVFHDPKADYPYRCFMSKADFAAIMTSEIGEIDYDNFKNSVADPVLHGLYHKVWSIMSVLGCGLFSRRDRRRGVPVEEADDFDPSLGIGGDFRTPDMFENDDRPRYCEVCGDEIDESHAQGCPNEHFCNGDPEFGEPVVRRRGAK